MLLLATDFYYLKNIAGRRLVGLRWWNEVDTATGDSHWVFESQDRGGDASGAGAQNLTDKRFFWLALYAQPGLWVGLAIFAIVRFENPIWLSLVGGFPPVSFVFLPFLLLQVFHTRCTCEWGREEKALCGREHLKRVL